MLQRREHFHPFGGFHRMQDNMDWMRRRIGPWSHWNHHGFSRFHGHDGWAAPLDVFTDGGHFVVRASMPGVSPDNIHVSIEDNVLTIRGETASHFESAEGHYLMRERHSGSFHRSLRLPDTVHHDDAEPRYEHGVLTITLPMAEARRAKQFEVKVVEGPVLAEAS